jgi:preprotein translocase subunit YajC
MTQMAVVLVMAFGIVLIFIGITIAKQTLERRRQQHHQKYATGRTAVRKNLGAEE